MNSDKAKQDITINCHNTVVYYDAVNKDYKNAVRLTTFTEQTLSASGSGKKPIRSVLKYVVDKDKDECQVCETLLF